MRILAYMERIKAIALRYAYGSSQLELSAFACALFSALIVIALGVHYGTLS